jgi:hypothetical protein
MYIYLFYFPDNNCDLCFVQVPLNLYIFDLFILWTQLIIIYYKTSRVLSNLTRKACIP